MKVLVIKSSMMKPEASYSSALNDLFVKHYKAKNPTHEIIELNLNKESIGLKSMSADNFGAFFNPEDSAKYIAQLKSVDKVILSCPMTNFNYPAAMKNYIDHISVANETFSYKYSKKGEAKGLLTNLKVQILTSQGAPMGWYPWGNHTETLRGTWNFLGANVAEPFVLAGTKVEPATTMPKDEFIAKFDQQIKKLAEQF